MPSFNLTKRVRCYNGKTVAEQNNWNENEKRFFHPWGDEPANIEDYLFDLIRFEESDEDYWNRTAERMISDGFTKIVIGENQFSITRRMSEEITCRKNRRLAEIDEWLSRKLVQWGDRPDNQNLARMQAASWRFKTINQHGYLKN